MVDALRRHWPEYLIAAVLLGFFMISAAGFSILIEHPASGVRQAVSDPFIRHVLMGCAMGATNLALIFSPWGQRSGAHMTPSITFTFLRLGKVAPSFVAKDLDGHALKIVETSSLAAGGSR
ncbi:MAG TPA: hypothetical protein VFD71_11445 [Planctomycetota bacterium]|nr:hypothetical protein [Planctomycetota bacterium]